MSIPPPDDDTQIIYDAHNKERRLMGVSAIARDQELEKIVKGLGCKTKFDLKAIPWSVCSKHGLNKKGVNLKYASDISMKNGLLRLDQWIAAKKFLVNGKCPDVNKSTSKCASYVNPFQEGKRVGCVLRTNCPGTWKLVATCIYCK